MKTLSLITFFLAFFVLTSFSQNNSELVNEKGKDKPKAVYQIGKAKITVWENKGKNGTWKNFEIECVYKKGGKWMTSDHFNEKELLDLKSAIEKAIAGENVNLNSSEEIITE